MLSKIYTYLVTHDRLIFEFVYFQERQNFGIGIDIEPGNFGSILDRSTAQTMVKTEIIFPKTFKKLQ